MSVLLLCLFPPLSLFSRARWPFDPSTNLLVEWGTGFLRTHTVCSHRYDDCGTRLGPSPTSASARAILLTHCDPRKRGTLLTLLLNISLSRLTGTTLVVDCCC